MLMLSCLSQDKHNSLWGMWMEKQNHLEPLPNRAESVAMVRFQSYQFLFSVPTWSSIPGIPGWLHTDCCYITQATRKKCIRLISRTDIAFGIQKVLPYILFHFVDFGAKDHICFPAADSMWVVMSSTTRKNWPLVKFILWTNTGQHITRVTTNCTQL